MVIENNIFKSETYGLNLTYNQIKEFHKAFNHPVSEIPISISKERKEHRAEWMREEINEFLEAKDIHEEADAMIDLIYFALGTLVEMGIDKPQNIMDIVQDANMSKLFPDGKPHYREDGKVIKPEGWESPDPKIKEFIENIIENRKKQGEFSDKN